MSLDGKVAIVTGSTQGLGLDIAKVLLAQGAEVMLVGRNAKVGHELSEALGPCASYTECDIENDEDIDTCIDNTINQFGKIDILVNNACLYADNGLASSREEWHQSLSVNIVSSAMFVQKVSAVLGNGSTIVNITSTGGKFGAAGRALYPASKAAMLQLTKNFAVSLAPQGIRVLSVSPAWTWSPSVASLTNNDIDLADKVGAYFHPLGRVGRGDEIGNVVAFLCTGGASWMTGVDVPVDGGFSILGPDRGLSPRVWFQRHCE
ncbi:TPA: SDR family oxidoreductase [Pseudomonas putida]|uniref:SDR family oxidoreductase n=1 Tax=Pseudomonas putida TaxID=303 RepID=UPI00110CF894|nr:SDR family oxidoreductase [Pseudomonas putida]MDD1992740.1 SDR family oxidoreductase [Pseudomonas putida]HDS0918418.1 SDR family oxidoreductase [Pseudomonas putida]HDS0931699.1 SDR family oxidoreductase [Pseudomonas putida]HDS1782327.1 SDR family oxidoreductase [Pseudomonas putida]HDS3796976.1 SDR family oxidoreductase [Pseudomonas putida]